MISTTRGHLGIGVNGPEEEQERERECVMGRLEVLVRVTGGVVGVWGTEREAGRLTMRLKLGKPSGCVVIHNMEMEG